MLPAAALSARRNRALSITPRHGASGERVAPPGRGVGEQAEPEPAYALRGAAGAQVALGRGQRARKLRVLATVQGQQREAGRLGV